MGSNCVSGRLLGFLKENLEPKLNLPRIILLAGDRAKQGRTSLSVRLRKQRRIGQVECFGPELDANTLSGTKALNDGEIEIRALCQRKSRLIVSLEVTLKSSCASPAAGDRSFVGQGSAAQCWRFRAPSAMGNTSAPRKRPD
jgi:hypothetical protein